MPAALVLNDPARVWPTFRHRLAETLSGLDSVVVPETVRLSAETIAESGPGRALSRSRRS